MNVMDDAERVKNHYVDQLSSHMSHSASEGQRISGNIKLHIEFLLSLRAYLVEFKYPCT